MKQLKYVGTSLKDLRRFPVDVQDAMLFAINIALDGGKHESAKPMKGFGGAYVLEISESHKGDAYRLVYTTVARDPIYVLHAFKKKSTRGIATPKADMEIINRRLKEAK